MIRECRRQGPRKLLRLFTTIPREDFAGKLAYEATTQRDR